MRQQYLFQLYKHYVPGKHDEEIEAIPRFRKITTFTNHSHCYYFDAKFKRKVCIDDVITNLSKRKLTILFIIYQGSKIQVLLFYDITYFTFHSPLEVYISAYYIPNLHKVETFPTSHNLRGSQSLSAVRTIFKIDIKDL